MSKNRGLGHRRRVINYQPMEPDGAKPCINSGPPGGANRNKLLHILLQSLI